MNYARSIFTYFVGPGSHRGQENVDNTSSGYRGTLQRFGKEIERRLYNTRSNDTVWFSQAVDGLLRYLGMTVICEDDLMRQVEKQTSYMSRREAATEVLIDHLIQKENGDKNKALLIIVSDKVEGHPGLPLLKKEHVVLSFVNSLLQRNARPVSCDENNQGPLHHAVKRGFRKVVSKLLDYDAYPLERDNDKKMPLHLALAKEQDEMATLILKQMPNDEVLKLFLVDPDNKANSAEFKFHDILKEKKKTMTNTALEILDCMVGIDESQEVKLDYSLLEADAEGRSRDHPEFKKGSETVFQLIAETRNKDVACHFVMKQFVNQKWKAFAFKKFICEFVIFLLTIICMTFAAVSGVMSLDPTHYDLPIDKARAVFEVCALMSVIFKLLEEFYQVFKHKLEYFKDISNLPDVASVCCILAVVPLRWTHCTEQWQVFGAGYLMWTIQVFKYAALTRRTGAYSQIIWQMISRDLLPFIFVFLVILLAFSGSFLLTLKGANSLDVHDETSNFWNILFTGVRILIEAQEAVDYANSYTVWCTILMVVFMFVTCVMLHNILIAQLSDTYQKVQQDAEREFIMDRICTINRLERDSLLFQLFHRCDKSVKLTHILEESDLSHGMDGKEDYIMQRMDVHPHN